MTLQVSMRDEPGTKREYETIFILRPDTNQEGITLVNTRVRQVIDSMSGKTLKLDNWGKRKLAYEIKKQKRGTYIVAFYEGPGASVGAIERDVNLSEDILRVLVTRVDHLSQKEMEAVEPQPIQPREERAPWDRPDFNRPMRPGRDSDRGPRREEGAAPAEIGAGEDKD